MPIAAHHTPTVADLAAAYLHGRASGAAAAAASGGASAPSLTLPGTSGAIAGPIVDLDLRTLYLNDLTFHGCTVTSLNVFPDLVGYIERGEIKPMLSATYPLKDFHAGQQAFIDKKHTGNIVVTIE